MKFALIVIVAVLVVLGGLSATAYFVLQRVNAPSDQELTVRVEPAVWGPLVEVIAVPGEIQPKTKVSISSRVSARVAELPHIEGDNVRRAEPGTTQPTTQQVLVRLDARDLEAALRSAEARALAQGAQIKVAESRLAAQKSQLSGTKVQLLDAQRDLTRKRELASSHDISQSEADTAQAKYDELAAQLEAAQHNVLSEEQNLLVLKYEQEASEAEIARARDELSYTTILSPIDGTITRLRSEVGEQVVPGIQGSLGSTIMEVADLSKMLMVARVDEANVAAVKPGQKAVVRIQAFRDETFGGTVESVALAKAEPTDRTRSFDNQNYYEAEILLQTNGRRIPSGLNADADIETKHFDGVRVPSQSIVARPVDQLPTALRNAPEVEKDQTNASVIFRYADGKVVATPVKIGASDDTHTLIVSGIKAGDLIVSGPYKALDSLANDQKVKKEDVAAKAVAATNASATSAAATTTATSVPAATAERQSP